MERVEATDLLTFINQASRTGLLEMERESQSTRIFFHHGNPVFASSSLQGLRLGDVLRRVGKIGPKELERCASRPRAAGDRIGRILVAEKLLTEAELGSFLKIQVSEVIFNSLSWEEGRFVFFDDVGHPPDVITIDMSLQNLIMEGVRRIDERGRLSEQFPNLEMLVEALTNPEWVKSNMSLTPEEWSVFFLVDGRRSLQEICELAGHVDQLTTLEVLNRLRETKLIGLRNPKPGAPAVPNPDDKGRTASNFRGDPSASRPARLPQAAAVPQAAAAPEAAAKSYNDTISIVNTSAVQYAGSGSPSARLAVDGAVPPVVYPLIREAYTLGRGAKNDIVLQDQNVSIFHARLERSAMGFTIYDLRSTNGTTVNMKRVLNPVVLKGNDVLSLGPVKLRYLEG